MVCPLPPDELRDPQGGGGKVLLGLCKLQNLTIRYIHTLSWIKLEMVLNRNLTCARYFYNDNLFGVGTKWPPFVSPSLEFWCPINPSSHVTQKAL